MKPAGHDPTTLPQVLIWTQNFQFFEVVNVRSGFKILNPTLFNCAAQKFLLGY